MVSFAKKALFNCDFSQELAFHEEERTRNKQVSFMGIIAYLHKNFTTSLMCTYHHINQSLKTSGNDLLLSMPSSPMLILKPASFKFCLFLTVFLMPVILNLRGIGFL